MPPINVVRDRTVRCGSERAIDTIIESVRPQIVDQIDLDKNTANVRLDCSIIVKSRIQDIDSCATGNQIDVQLTSFEVHKKAR